MEPPMTEDEKTRLRVAERNVRVLEQRLIRLEEEMALCLRWMRVQAELEAKKRDPLFVPGGSTKKSSS